MLSIENLAFAYGNDTIFRNVSFECEAGKITSIIGTNGTGKTTLLKCIADLNKIKEGEISIDGKNRKNMARGDFAAAVGFLDQNSYCTAQLNVYEVILLGRIRNLSFKVSDEDIERVEAVSELLGIKRFLGRNIMELSGGQRQMVFIAQTLIKEPQILILDEPTSALDINHQFKLMNLIQELTKERHLTTLMTLHHLDLAANYSDKIVIMHDGGIYSQGSAKEMITQKMFREVYQVETDIFTDRFGKIHAIPTKEL